MIGAKLPVEHHPRSQALFAQEEGPGYVWSRAVATIF